MSKAVDKYLHHYAEQQTHDDALDKLQIDREFVLVVPCYDEQAKFVERLSRHQDAERILLILVLNEPETDTGNRQNQVLRAWLEANSSLTLNSTEHVAGHLGDLYFLLLDHTEARALPAKQGVGLARKIGADLAVKLLHTHKIRSPWLFSSDADCHLPPAYFASAKQFDVSTAAITFDFEHVGEHDLIAEATQLYESQLRYYREQLEKAASPYAFFTLGSCMAISARHYCQARGFPKKPAGEDFYLLNKLAKLGRIAFSDSIKIRIDARVSDRVPFGTGPAVQKLVTTLKNAETPHYYHPEIFRELSLLLCNIDQFWREPESTLLSLSDAARVAMIEAGLPEFIKKRKKQDKTLAQFRKSFHDWFDAFQTLKFIHRLQISAYPPSPFPHNKG